MARNDRVGGVNSWRKAADDSIAYRPSAAKVKDRELLQDTVTVPEFKDDTARYGWEMEQWRNAILTRRKWRKWIGSDGLWHVGPPALPDAPVFSDEVAQRAFKKANEAGYIAPRHVGERISVSRYEAKRLIDGAMGKLRVAFVTYPHRMMKGTVWNCRMLHEDDVDVIGSDLEHWRAEMRKKFKSREVPPPSDRMKKHLGK
mgnify:FL=1